MKKLILAVIIVVLSFEIVEGQFFESGYKFLESSQNTGTIDFTGGCELSQDENISVNITNTGESEMVVRVRLIPMIVDSEGAFYKLDLPYELVVEDSLWYEGGDGYFYFKNRLLGGESLEDSFLLEVNYFQKYDRELVVKAYIEGLQARNGACEDAWQIGEEIYSEI